MKLSADLLDLRYRGGGHVENWFLKANEPGGRRALTVRMTIFARPTSADRGKAPVPPIAEAWAVAFDRERGHVATKTAVPLSSARFAHGALDVEVDGCELSLGRSHGALASGTRKVTWDLALGPSRAAPIFHLPSRALYDAPLVWKAVSPVSDGRASGVVEVDHGEGDPPEPWRIDEWPAMVGHTWGPANARLYAWVHCNTWDDAEDLTLDAISARVRLGPMLSPMPTAVFVRWKGKQWDLNARELFGKNRGSISLRRWEATARGQGLDVRAELAAETDDFVGLHYPNPSGAMTYCLNTKLARARLELRLPGMDPFVATSRAGALEIGTHDRQHGVRMYL